MAKQRFINTKFWSDNFIVKLDPIERYLFLYFLTNEHTNICGIYELPMRTMEFETGIKSEMLDMILKRFDKKIFYIDGWVYIKNFTKHQRVNESITKGIKNIMDEVPDKIKEKICEVGQSDPSLSPTCSLFRSISISKSNKEVATLAVAPRENLNPLIDKFKSVNPNHERLFSNKTQRLALSRLVDKHGYEKIDRLMDKLPEIVTKKAAPRITTPLQLETKMGDLVIFVKQEMNQLKTKVHIMQ